jgi:hypothetical protein
MKLKVKTGRKRGFICRVFWSALLVESYIYIYVNDKAAMKQNLNGGVYGDFW